MQLTLNQELAIRDDLSTYNIFIAIEGTPMFDSLRDVIMSNDPCDPASVWCQTFNLSEVVMPDGSVADVITCTALPAAVTT